jgi:outer membrane protein assembly factor BamB
MTARIPLLILSASFLFSCSREPELRSARVVLTGGNASVELNNLTRPLSAGERVWAGTSITTGPSSVCDLQIGGHVIRLRPDSSIILRDLQRFVRLELKSGTLLVRLAPMDPEHDRFQVMVSDITADFRDKGGLLNADAGTITAGVRDGVIDLIRNLYPDRIVLSSNRQIEFNTSGQSKPEALSASCESELRGLDAMRSVDGDDRKTGLARIISAPPGADIFIDGQFSYRTPLDVILVSDRDHILRAEMPGFNTSERSSRVTPAGRNDLLFSLTPDATNFRVLTLWEGGIVRGAVRADFGSVAVRADGSVLRLRPAAKPVWTRETGSPVTYVPCSDSGIVFAYAASEELSAFSIQDGQQLWKKKIGTLKSAPAASGGAVFFGTTASMFVCLDAKTGKENWFSVLPGGITTSPATGPKTVYVRTADNSIHALDKASGKRIWKASIPGKYASIAPLAADGKVYAINSAGEIHCFDANGKTLFSRKTGLKGPGALAFTSGSLICANSRGEVIGLDGQKGVPLWKKATGRSLTSPAVAVDGQVFLGFGSGTVQVLDPKTGEVTVIRRVPGKINSLVPSGAGVIVSSDQGVYLITR